MRKLKVENTLTQEFVEPKIREAMLSVFDTDLAEIPSESAMALAQQFGADKNFSSILNADKDDEAVRKFLSSFYNNLNLLVQKTWVEESDEAQKAHIQFRLDAVCKVFLTGDFQTPYKELVSLLHEVVSLMFGVQLAKTDFLEYAFRIDPEFGIFWWYVENLPEEAPESSEKARIYLLLGMVFLSNY